MLEHTGISNGILWNATNDMGKMAYCWGAGNLDTFMVSNSYDSKIPELKSVYNLNPQTLMNNTLNATSTMETQSSNGVSV
jgi:hypothetical protein